MLKTLVNIYSRFDLPKNQMYCILYLYKLRVLYGSSVLLSKIACHRTRT